jgi:hypothetical protein
MHVVGEQAQTRAVPEHQLDGSMSEIITAPAGSYTFAFNTGSDSLHLSVSAVPLPASFPLFALALVGLGMFGYHTARRSGRTSSVPA